MRAPLHRPFPSPVEWRQYLGLRPLSLGFAAISHAMRGLPLPDDEMAAYVEMSGGLEPPEGGFSDCLVIKVRRAGGTEWLGGEGAFECAYGAHERVLAPGQVATFPIFAPRLDQAEECLNYARGVARQPKNGRLIAKDGTAELVFRTRTRMDARVYDVNAASSLTSIGFGSDEMATAPGDDASQPDRVIEDKLSAATAPLVGAPPRRRIRVTSPHIQEGIAYEYDRDYFGVSDAPIVVLRGCFRLLNPAIDRKWLAKEAKRLKPAVFLRDFGDGWDLPPVWMPSVIDGWFSDVIERSVDKGRNILPYDPRHTYFIGLDAAFRRDGFALAVCHRERRADGKPITVVDGVWCWKPEGDVGRFIEFTIKKSVKVIREYRCGRVFADQHQLDLMQKEFREHGVFLNEAIWRAQGEDSKSFRFRRVYDAMLDELVKIPDDLPTIREFHAIRSKQLRSGTEQFEARSGHDDRVHAIVMAVSEALERQPPLNEVEQRKRDKQREADEYLLSLHFGGDPVW